MKDVREDDAEALYGKEVADLLLMVKDLRDTLQLACHNPGEMTKREIDKDINAATKLLKKYGLGYWG